MEKLVFLIKSYKPDFKRVLTLLDSISKYNRDKIPVFIAVNDEDYIFFKKNINFEVTILKDSSIYETQVTDGWRYQQIIKTQFYRLQLSKNYLCIDSDSEFIRDFYISDFMYDGDTPYTIMHESKGFLETMERINIDSSTIFFKEALLATRKILGTKGKLWDYGPSPYLWSCKVWEHFNEVYLKSTNQSFEDFFKTVESIALPSETVIYGEYLRICNLIQIIPVEGFFKIYHYEEQYKLEKKHHDIEKLKKVYLGIIYQSNWYKKRNNKLMRLFRKN